MPRTTLTERTIRDAKPGSKPVILWDSRVKGLGCRVHPSGAKAFVLAYRTAGRKRLCVLARVGECSLREARERAGRELARVRDGEAGPLARREEKRAAPTVADGVARFLDEYLPARAAAGRISPRTIYDYRKQAARTVLPGLGALKIADVSRGDVERAVAGRARVQRNRSLALISSLFNRFEDWDWRPQGTNPCHGIERAREEPRDRVLSPSELRAIGANLPAAGNPYAEAAIKFLTLTGWRSGEALALKWQHVDFETGLATLPTTKAGRQVRPLSGLALDVLKPLPRVAGNPFCFAGARGVAIGYRTLRDGFKRVRTAAGIDDCRLHDLRRTAATTAAAAGLSVFLLRDLLGHRSAEMANRYARRAGAALQSASDDNARRMARMLEGD